MVAGESDVATRSLDLVGDRFSRTHRSGGAIATLSKERSLHYIGYSLRSNLMQNLNFSPTFLLFILTVIEPSRLSNLTALHRLTGSSTEHKLAIDK
ncbi:hypothetical protein H6G17_19915 [Chroococcidiopsis sp. FACHB-1243]|uniref:hypothetical protein n=1 Tax=Chroococcidiopsis sp. [FACHB-1243] TaxID=2692781 RepID=UPI00177AFDAB|nr:hypothetical protein [Chroococcidiopsis sp. [FACHB-1243]]MBD2307738.1 hypothetical protein [Chroococcidiopsis sp. [FACHB-1243]]